MNGATVRIQYSDGRVEERGLTAGSYVIGRESGDLVLGDPNVSSRHAQLTVQPATVTVTDVGSTNGTFDSSGARLTTPRALSPNDWVRMGRTTITLVAVAPAPAGTQLMPQQPMAANPAPATAAELQSGAAAPAPNHGPAAYAPTYMAPPEQAASGGTFSHPEQPVRHSYPVAQQSFGVGAAAGLLMKTAPFIAARLAVLVGASVAGLVYWLVVIGGTIFLGERSPVLGWGWLIVTLGVAGWLWRTVIRYFLYLLKAGHIAVLTEIITRGEVGNGQESMFAYGKRIVQERFGQVNVLFGIDLLVDGVVRAFNRTLDWLSDLIPIPGLDSVMAFVNSVVFASTTYIDETLFSYNLARGDDNVFRSSKDGLIYYAQNSKEILKTGVWVVILEKVLSFAVFVVVFVPALAVAYLLPSSWGFWMPLTAIVAGLLFAADVQQAVLRPLFLTMVMLKFHSVVREQPINLQWDQRLESASDKFRELKEKALGAGPSGNAAPQALPAE